MSGKHTSKESFLKWFVFFIAFILFSAIPIYVQASTFVIDIEATIPENQSGFPDGLNRYESMQTEDSSQFDSVGEGDYWEQYNVFNDFYEEWERFKLMFHIEGYKCKVSQIRLKKWAEKRDQLSNEQGDQPLDSDHHEHDHDHDHDHSH